MHPNPRTLLSLVALAAFAHNTVGHASSPVAPTPLADPPLHLIPPWSAVESHQDPKTGASIGVWGRTCRFANAPLPTSIVTAGEEILTGPIRIAGTCAGKPITWTQGGTMIPTANESEAIVSGWQASDSIIINTSTRIAFDGMMQIDLVVLPQAKASPKLERLWLELPLKRNRATLHHFWPGQWGSARNSGATPQPGLSLPFKPFVWLGWEQGGLGWFAESDRGWQPADQKQAIEITTGSDQCLLRLHLLDSAPPKLPITFTFGLQASPVKPWPTDFHEWRICHGTHYGHDIQIVSKDPPQTALEHAAALGVRTLIFHENWTPIQNYPFTDREADLRSLISAIHRNGMKLLLYYGYELSSLAPEWGKLSDDVLVKTPSGLTTGGYHRQPEQRDYTVCYNSPWRDLLLEGITESLDRYGYDGVYLDGTTEPWACANERHGCGYRTPEGTLKATYPIFAVRKLMHRLASIIHPRGGRINAHQSTCCTTPTLGFVDSYWDGEQFQGGELSGDPLKNLPLDGFRAEFMGRNFGIPCEFLVYPKPPGWTFDHALAVTMLHDVRVRPGGLGPDLAQMSKIWKAMSDFDTATASWHPYWEPNPLVVVTQPSCVKASCYSHPADSQKPHLLLVTSNLSASETATAQLAIDLSRAQITAPHPGARDAITREPVTIEGNRITIPIQPMRMRMIEVE